MNKLSKILSVVLHPIFIPIVFLFLVCSSDYYFNTFFKPEAFRILAIVVCVFAIAIPVLIITISRYIGLIQSFEMKSKTERIFSLVLFIVSMYFSLRVIEKFGLPEYYIIYMIAFSVMLLLTAILTFFFRISIHTVGWGTFTGLLIAYMLRFGVSFYVCLPIVVVLSGLAAWARLELQAHSKMEIYSGYLLGLFGTIVFVLCV